MDDKWHGGKGSKRRPEDSKKYSDNWDRIFKKERDISKLKNVVEIKNVKRKH